MLDLSDADASEHWRQIYHIAPPTGLMNDPNGLIHWQGHYHVFFQWNPEECAHANKHWGHARSTDLLTWEWLPAALLPDRPYDARGCYSGSAVEDGGALCVVYSGNAYLPDGRRISRQCLAVSADGVTFEKHGPVIDGSPEGYTGHFRDPKLWRDGDRWLMVLGAQTVERLGTVLLLASADLLRWTVVGPLLQAGAHGYMCECPDLFALGGRDVLLFCEQRDGVPEPNISGYAVGTLDPDGPAFRHDGFCRLDHGRDFYAPQTFLAPDGRRLLIGWMGLPDELHCPTADHGWMHGLTLPRELSLVDGIVHQQPPSEFSALRGAGWTAQHLTVTGDHWVEAAGRHCEIDLLVDADGRRRWSVDVRCTPDGERTTLSVDPAAGIVSLVTVGDALCRRSGNTVRRIGRAPLPPAGIGRVRIFVDGSSVEVFINDGALVMTAKIYPGREAGGMRLRAEGSVVFQRVSVWPLRRPEVNERIEERLRSP